MVKFALDLDVIKTKIVLLSKKLHLVGSISSSGSSWFNEDDLEGTLARASRCGKLLPVFYSILFRNSTSKVI